MPQYWVMSDDLSPGLLPEEEMAVVFATRPLDTIALPLLAPLAEFVVRCEEHPFWTGRIGELPAYEGACRAALGYPDASDPPVLAAVLLAGTLAAQCADTIADFITLDAYLFEDGEGPSTLADMKQWFVRERPHPAMAALASAALAAYNGGAPLFPATSNRVKEISRALYHYTRFQGATDWPSAYSLARDYWSDAAHRETLLLQAWSAALGQITIMEGRVEDLEKRHRETLAAARQRDAQPTLALVQQEEEEDADDLRAELGALREELREAAAQIAGLQQQLRDTQASARSARSERNAARKELEPLRRELDRQTRHARAITLLHAELSASLEAGQAEDIEPPPEEGWPADLLAGCTIQLFTGQERAGARAQMADALRAVGATVSTSAGNGREGVPDSFPEGSIVVCDVRFMAHTWSGRLADRARRSGATYIEVRAGQGGIVRAVAAALGKDGS
jgi:hypothetical protein